MSLPSPITPPITPPGTVPTVTAALPPAPPLAAAAPLVPAAMPAESPRSSSNGCYMPVLTKANFLKWQMCVEAYLTPHDHVRVIERMNVPGHGWVDPVAPTDARLLEAWLHSERMARGIIVSTAVDLHLELVHKHRQGAPWTLWQAIEAKHVKQDASFRHGAWMNFLGIRHGLDEPYVDFLGRITDARAQIDRVTPPGLSIDERMDELLLFTALCGMRTDDPLRRQLVSQKNICLDDVAACFLRTDQDASISAKLESANAAAAVHCFICRLLGHLAKDCPHADTIERLVSQRAGSSLGNQSNTTGGKRKKSKGGSAAMPTPTTPSTTPSSASVATETAGVATSFYSSNTRVTNGWIVDSGATSCMSYRRSIFSDLKPDRRAIRLANGSLIYSGGVGSIRFLSNCGYYITIHNVLYVPTLSSNLFASNRFAREHRDSYLEVLDFPQRWWINRLTGATEFTATIRSDDLAHLDWVASPSVEHANVTIAELHSRLNHLPISAVRRLLLDKPVAGLPDCVAGPSSGDFCEDCVSGKLTRAPHTKLAARAERPLFRIFTDVHGPLPVRSRHGHVYWVSFVDDHSRFPAVYFVSKKLDVFAAFRKYKAWAENLTGRKIGILRDDKGGEYLGTDFDEFLSECGIRREHSIRDTPQQLGVAEHLNRSISEGVTTLLSQLGLSRAWWEEAATHWLYGKIRLPSSVTKLTPFELFYGQKPDVSHLRPFGCLAYVHLQKDQRPALAPHAAQCVVIGYPSDYKGWRFWNLSTQREIVSDSAVFRESVFPFHNTGLSGVQSSVDPSPPSEDEWRVPASLLVFALPALPALPAPSSVSVDLHPEPARLSSPAPPVPLLSPPPLPSHPFILPSHLPHLPFHLPCLPFHPLHHPSHPPRLPSLSLGRCNLGWSFAFRFPRVQSMRWLICLPGLVLLLPSSP